MKNKYATLEELKAVDLRFNDFATLTDLLKVEDKLNQFKSNVVETYIPEVEAEVRIKELKTEVYDNFPHKDNVKSKITIV